MAQPQLRETPERETREATEQELSAVLGRFRAWNSNSENAPRSDSRRQPDPDSYHPADSAACLEEISYEDALGARRNVARPRTVASPKPSPRMPQTPVAAIGPAKAPATMRRRTAKTEAAPVAPRPQRTPPQRTGSQQNRPQKTRSQPSLKASVSRAKAASVPALASRNPAPAQATPQRPHSKPGKSTFQEVMQESLAVNMSKSHRPEATDRVALIRNGEQKSLALNLRASAHEHAVIQAGASEAGVSIAEYMRQCTLDVQVLRTLLNQTIASRQLGSLTSAPHKRLRSGEQTSLALPSPAAFPMDPDHATDHAIDQEETFVTRLKTLFFGTRKR